MREGLQIIDTEYETKFTKQETKKIRKECIKAIKTADEFAVFWLKDGVGSAGGASPKGEGKICSLIRNWLKHMIKVPSG